MSNECKCLNPDGGGTKCPPQHIALCIRGKDNQCYGECIPIPREFRFNSPIFNGWLNTEIEEIIKEFISGTLIQANRFEPPFLDKTLESPSTNGGVLRFASSIGDIYVRFNFQFRDGGFTPPAHENFEQLTV